MRERPPRRRQRMWIAVAAGGVLFAGAAVTIALVVTRDDDAPARVEAECSKYDLVGCPARCDDGDGEACWLTGNAVANGLGVRPDRPAGIDLLRRACDLGELRGCVTGMRQLQLAAEAGEVPDGWQGEFIQRLDAACDRRFAQACRMIALSIREGLVPGDLARVPELLDRACALGDRVACVQEKHPSPRADQ